MVSTFAQIQHTCNGFSPAALHYLLALPIALFADEGWQIAKECAFCQALCDKTKSRLFPIKAGRGHNQGFKGNWNFMATGKDELLGIVVRQMKN